MDIYLNGNTVLVSAKNIPQFRLLIEKANAEAFQLQKTINELNQF